MVGRYGVVSSFSCLLVLASVACTRAGGHGLPAASRDYALELDGIASASSPVIPFHPRMNAYAATRQLTLEAWVKPGKVDTAGPIIQKAVGLCKDDWVLGLAESLTVHFIAANSCRGDGKFLAAPRALRPNVWQHLAAVWDGDSMHIYVDGRRKASASFAGIPTTNEIGVGIGNSNHWDGNSKTLPKGDHPAI
jgi:hypothetical protein